MFFLFINSWAHNNINYQRLVHASVVNLTWPWEKRGNLRLLLLSVGIKHQGSKKNQPQTFFSAQMNSHGKLSKDRKCWEQANWCLSVTTSAAGDNAPQKIPTGLLEWEIQHCINCSSFEYFLSTRMDLRCSVKYCCILSFIVHTLPWEIHFSKWVQAPTKYFKVSRGRFLPQSIKKPEPS